VSKEEAGKGEVKQLPLSKVALRGSYLLTIETPKKTFYTNPNYHVCYDPTRKKFYVLNWIVSNSSNIFPSLVTIVTDLEHFETSPLHTIAQEVQGEALECRPASSLGELAETALAQLLKLQRFKFKLPWRLNRWDVMYGHLLHDQQSKMYSSPFILINSGAR